MEMKTIGELKNEAFVLKSGAPPVFQKPRIEHEVMLGEEEEDEDEGPDFFYEESKTFLQPFFSDTYSDFLLCSLDTLRDCDSFNQIGALYKCVVEAQHTVEYDIENRLRRFWSGLTSLALFCDYIPQSNVFVFGRTSSKTRLFFSILAYFFHDLRDEHLPFRRISTDHDAFVSYTRCAFVVLKLLTGDCRPEFVHYVIYENSSHATQVSSYFLLYQVRLGNHLMAIKEKKLREEEMEEYQSYRPPAPDPKYYTPLEEEEEEDPRGKRLRFSSTRICL